MNDIRIHLHKNEDIQLQLEEQTAAEVVRNGKASERAFKANIPTIGQLLREIKAPHISIFCNANGEYNIVDYGTGKAFYGPRPQREVDRHLEEWAKNAKPIYLIEEHSNSTKHSTSEGLKAVNGFNNASLIETLVVFGIGGGLHLIPLISQYDIKHLIIYEPELQYLKASTFLIDWSSFFLIAQRKNIQVFLMPGQDGRDLIDNLCELQQHTGIDKFFFYKHYNHPVFQAVSDSLISKSWQDVCASGFQLQNEIKGRTFKPLWTGRIGAADLVAVESKNSDIFKRNLAAFSKYVPSISKEFKEYEPEYWIPVVDIDGSINLFDKTTNDLLYNEPKLQGLRNKENFERYPNKDGLILGYNGGKLKSYLHYQYVSETDKLLEDLHEARGKLPENVKSLILFGLGVGYEFEALLNDHELEMLFVVEPNRDFFFASLFAIDWCQILNKIDKNNGRIYINIGDDGRNLFGDLTQQFYSIGPYNLANTYFFQTYYNSALAQAIASLREQLKLMVSIGEYYDHVKYGISHTREMITKGTPVLRGERERQISSIVSETPIFLIGNGPSLDRSIETIQEFRDQAIIISCGTALMPLFKKGIVPDFHAEIEQNRATFDWCSRVGSLDYLKKITLLSCNGIHPDTSTLFKQTLIAFKDGESSTAACLDILGRDKFTELEYAFPTVSNLALNLSCELGFTQIYLFGIDLGFVDDSYHHSKQSGYYNRDGNQLVDFKKDQNTSIKVKGNFRSYVFTKQEFKMARILFEQALSRYKRVDAYNTSDGAMIAGSKPLRLDHVLIGKNEGLKQSAIDFISSVAFKSIDNHQGFFGHFDNKFQLNALEQDFHQLITLIDETEADSDAVEQLVEAQKKLLFGSYQRGDSLFFYFMHGTINYSNALLSKIVSSEDSTSTLSDALSMWSKWVNRIYDDIKNDQYAFDVVSAYAHLRRQAFLLTAKSEHKVIVRGYRGNDAAFIEKYTRYSQNKPSIDPKLEYVVISPNASDINGADRVLMYQDGGKLEELLHQKSMLQEKPFFSLYWQPWSQTTLAIESVSVSSGESPLLAKNRIPYWLAEIRNSLDSDLLFVKKIEFVKAFNFDETIESQLDSIVGQLQHFNSFLVFTNYLVFGLDKNKQTKVYIDSTGERPIIFNRQVTKSDLITLVPTVLYKKYLSWPWYRCDTPDD